MSETASAGEGAPAEGAENAGTENGTSKTSEWYEGELSRVRQEAAGARVKAKEKVEAAKAEVTSQFEAQLAASNTAHEATKDELASATLNNTKLDTALEAVLGEEVAKKVRAFAKTVQGSNPDELKAHAEELKALFGITGEAKVDDPATDPSQGMGGNAPAGDDFGSWMTSKFLNR